MTVCAIFQNDKVSLSMLKKEGKVTVRRPGAKRAKRSSAVVMARVLEAAREEFKRRGFVGATTAVIARNAAVTEAQLFRYFDSKADLFQEAVFEPLDRHFSDSMRAIRLRPEAAKTFVVTFAATSGNSSSLSKSIRGRCCH
jgi:AcrR family transcriptional regulator